MRKRTCYLFGAVLAIAGLVLVAQRVTSAQQPRVSRPAPPALVAPPPAPAAPLAPAAPGVAPPGEVLQPLAAPVPRFKEFMLENGTTVLVETVDGGYYTAGPGAEQAAAPGRLDQVAQQVGPLLDGIFRSVQRVASTPDEVTVEVGIGVTAGAKIAIVNTEGRADLKVSATWRRKGAAGAAPAGVGAVR